MQIKPFSYIEDLADSVHDLLHRTGPFGACSDKPATSEFWTKLNQNCSICFSQDRRRTDILFFQHNKWRMVNSSVATGDVVISCLEKSMARLSMDFIIFSKEAFFVDTQNANIVCLNMF